MVILHTSWFKKIKIRSYLLRALYQIQQIPGSRIQLLELKGGSGGGMPLGSHFDLYSLISCVTLGKGFNPLESWFPHLH